MVNFPSMHKNSVHSILITGSKGFIGSRLVEKLKQKYRIINLDKDDCDIRNKECLEVFFKQRPDLVIHLGAEVGRLHGEENPELMLQTNVLGTLNVAMLCRKYRIKMINFSTSEVYGLTLMDGDEFDEEVIDKVSAFKMTNIYGLSKYFGEAIVRHYSKYYGLHAISVRPFMIYGAGIIPSKYRSALDQFTSNLIQNKPIQVHKDSIRCWCHVSDFIRGIEAIIERHVWGEYEAYNVGFDEYISMEDTAKMLCDKLGKNRKLIKIVRPPDFLVVKKKVSFKKFKKLGVSQLINISEGLDELIDWHKSLIMVK